MNKSEKVIRLKDRFEKNPVKLDQKDVQLKLNEKLFNKALLKICDYWNNTDGSRNFIKHLIGAFLPIDPLSRMMSFSEEDLKVEKNRCSLLNIKLAGLNDIINASTEFTMLKMRVDAKVLTEHRTEYDKKELAILKKARSKFPIEVKNGTVAYGSETSSKYLSGEAVFALSHFVGECILLDEKEVVFSCKKNIYKRGQERFKNKLTNSQLNKVAKSSTFGMTDVLDSETLDKLKSLKSELD